jgi:hypothetical protein
MVAVSLLSIGPIRSEEMCRLLLDAGADVNRGGGGDGGAAAAAAVGRFGFGRLPICGAVCFGEIEVVRVLLQHGANPNLSRRPSNEENEDRRRFPRNTDMAIENGDLENSIIVTTM